MFTDDQRLFDSMRTGPSSRLHTTSSTGRTRPDERKLRIALVMLPRTLAALTAMTAVTLALTAAGPPPTPVASLPSASATDPDYPYLWPEEGTPQPRDARPGDTLLVSTNDGVAHPQDTVRSPVFTEPVTLHGAKSSYVTAATVRCDAKPGVYPVYLVGEQRDSTVWAKVRVQPTSVPTAACAHPSPYTTEELWPLLSPVAPVRPGESAHIALGANAAALVGDVVDSPTFDGHIRLRETKPRDQREAVQPTLEQLTHSFTADVTVRCGTRPGLYPVRFGFGGGAGDGGVDYRFETQVRVLPADGNSQMHCNR